MSPPLSLHTGPLGVGGGGGGGVGGVGVGVGVGAGVGVAAGHHFAFPPELQFPMHLSSDKHPGFVLQRPQLQFASQLYPQAVTFTVPSEH